MLELSDVLQARERIAEYVVHTPLLRAPQLDNILGCQVYIKPENLQRTGSFKVRGASSKMTMLSEEEKRCGVVTASSGNHAKALSYIAQRMGMAATVIMPINPNPAKLEGIRSYGAEVMFEGTQSGERIAKAKSLVAEKGYTFVHSHADFYVLAGQGTIALEILEDEPQMDVIVSPVGGGGLISGVSTAAKGIKPEIRVFGAEPQGASRYSKSLEAGKALTIETSHTIADGTRCNHADADNFEIIRRRVDGFAAVSEDSIRKAVKLCAEQVKIIAEPSSVMGIAAALQGDIPITSKDKVCFIITGGNNDLSLLAEILKTAE